MANGFSEFLKGLRFEEGKTSQIEIAEEAVKKQLFIVINELNLENGQVVKMDNVVQLISDKLGIQGNKNKIAQIITKVLDSGEYLQRINKDGNIEAAYGTVVMLQKERENTMHREAEASLSIFVEKAKQYASQLDKKNVKVTEITLMNQFSEEELKKNGSWIDIAINHVLEKQNKDR